MKYIDETERVIASSTRILRVLNVSDVPEVVRELLGSPHPKLAHLRCVVIRIRAEVEVLDLSSARLSEEKVLVKNARITAHYEVPQ